MSFCSFTFILIFLPIVIFLYYICKNRTYRNTILVVASLLFYAWGEPKYILMLLCSILLNYVLAIFIEKSKYKKLIFIIDILFNISLIFIFKYLNFSIFTINNLFHQQLKTYQILLPIGISFYTFQIMSYIIDVYQNKVKAEKNIFNVTLYISFFPQLIAGPIVKYEDIYQQIKNRDESINKVYYGLKRFMIGFSKKIILANNLAIVCDTIYGYDITNLSLPILWLAAVSFALQIYFDFSGYSDMAIGLAKMFGFDILENFDYPYISTSITEFWKRWHISLTNWFRTYVYIPLGGNRCSKMKWIRNMLIVFLLTGIWHGANYNFIIWGLYNAFFLIIERLFLNKLLKKVPKMIKWIITMIIITVGWTIFRITDMNTLMQVLKGMFNFSNLNFFHIYYKNYKMVLSSLYIPIAMISSFPILIIIKKKIKNKSLLEIISFLGVFGIYIYSLYLLIQETSKSFIYFKF